jgi:hypothetical protein
MASSLRLEDKLDDAIRFQIRTSTPSIAVEDSGSKYPCEICLMNNPCGSFHKINLQG